jgi:hypothetical protein
MAWGYVRSALRGESRLEDAQLRRFIRRYQRLCLTLGKRRATARIEREQAACWYSRQQISPEPRQRHDYASAA